MNKTTPTRGGSASQPASLAPASPAAPPRAPQLILVAEDEHLLARSLQHDLAELGFIVAGPARNGQEAIELARQRRPDLALLDIRMPEMDGLAAAEVLFEQMGVPVVILSAYSDSSYVEAGARLGVFGYLLKPVSLDELRVSIAVAWSRYLKHHALTRDLEHFKAKLEERKLIEKAKGLLMKLHGLGEEEAMRSLQKQARDSRRPMAELAQSLLDAQGLLDRAQMTRPSPPPTPPPPGGARGPMDRP